MTLKKRSWRGSTLGYWHVRTGSVAKKDDEANLKDIEAERSETNIYFSGKFHYLIFFSLLYTLKRVLIKPSLNR
jgi:hypothetical protein